MGWRDSRGSIGRSVRLAIVLASSALSAGCFQPLYGEGNVAGGFSARDALAAVEVPEIGVPANSSESRLAVQIRNDLIFNFTGGGAPSSPTHRLKVQINGGRSIISINPTTKLPDTEVYGLNTTYSLTEIATGKVVVTGRATTNISYETLGQQRFARISGMHDAERKAAKVISDNITTRLASYFIGGG